MRRRGFTLLEVLIAVGILGGALMAVAGAVDIGARRIMLARELVVASRLANSILQEVLATEDLGDVLGEGAFEDHRGFRWRVDAEEEGFEIAELELAPEMRKVTIEVTWRAGDRRVVLVTRRPLELGQR